MVREVKNRIFFIVTLFALLVVLTGCSGGNQAPRKYYTGYDSIEMRFLQDTPPTVFYYDSEAQNFQQNTIPINVELYNRGSSDTYGALFIHGFDPNIVAVQGYTPNYPGYTGPIRGSAGTAFGGWYGNSDNYGIQIGGIPIGNAMLNLGVANVGGRQVVSFSTFGFTNRGNFFSAMGYQTNGAGAGYVGIAPGVVSARVGAILNPITRGMFSTFGWSGWLQSFEMEGRNPNNPAGGMEVIEFPATILTLPPSLEQFTQRIMVTSCFDYATHASAVVCLDPEPYSNVRKACRAQTVALGGGQGAPVAVTSVEQRPGRGRTTFVINVRHNRKNAFDELYDYFSLYKCDPASGEIVKTTDKNIVYVGYVYLSNLDITMSCIPDQVIRLDDAGNGQITCSVEFPTGIDGKPLTTSAYQAPLEIELWYGYSKTIFRDVVIRRI